MQGISFTLNHPMVGYVDPSIIGSASTSSLLAVISDSLAEDSLFVDDNQRILRLKNKFATDGEVHFYNVSLEDPFTVLTDLRVRSTELNADDDKFLPNLVTKTYTFNWDDKANRPSGTYSEKSPSVSGGKLRMRGLVDWQFNGFGHLAVQFAFMIEGIVGIGVQFRGGQPPTPEKFSQCQKLFGQSVAMAGIVVGGPIEACLDIELKEIVPVFKSPFEYYQTWEVMGSRTGMFRKSKSHWSAPKFEVASGAQNTANLKELALGLAALVGKLVPVFKVYLRANLTAGNLVQSIKVGLEAEVQLEFKFEASRCVSPYLWRSGTSTFFGFAEIPAFEHLTGTLFEKQDPKDSVPRVVTLPGGCLFQPSNNQEKDSTRINALTQKVFFLTDFTVKYINLKKETNGNKLPSSARFELVQGSMATKTVLVHRKPVTSEATSTIRVLGAGFGIVVSTGTKVRLVIGTTGSVDQNIEELGKSITVDLKSTVSVGGKATLSYKKAEISQTKVFTEFTLAQNENKVAVEASVSRGQEMGLIIHGPGEEGYLIPSDVEYFAPVNPNAEKPHVGYYKRENQCRIVLGSFTPKINIASLTMTFFRGTVPLAIARGRDLIAGKVYNGAELDFEDLAFDLTPGDEMKVKIQWGTNQACQGELKVSVVQMTNPLQPVAEWDKENVGTLVLGLDISGPTVVAQLKTKGNRGVFCRVIRRNGYVMDVERFEEGETYGILDVAIPNFVSNAGSILYAVVNLPGCTPLLHSLQLDENAWAIPLTTAIWKDKNLKIPFRRNLKGKITSEQMFGVYQIFSGTADLLCRPTSWGAIPSASAVGCIEPRWKQDPIEKGWVGIAYSTMIPEQERYFSPSSKGSFELYEVRVFDMSNNDHSDVYIFQVLHSIPTDTAFIIIPRDVVALFGRRKIPLFVRAPGGTDVEVYCGGVTKNERLTKQGTMFSGEPDPGCQSDWQLVALTTDSSLPFRAFELGNFRSALFSYGDTNEGLIQIRGGAPKFRPGFRRQVAKHSPNALVYKTWSGRVTEKMLWAPGKLTIDVTSSVEEGVPGPDGYHLKPWFRGNQGVELRVDIPWGIDAFARDSDKFFKTLGVSKPGKVYESAKARLTDNGTLVINQSFIDMDKVVINVKNNPWLLDLLDGDVTECLWRVVEPMKKDAEDDDVADGEVGNGLDQDTIVILEVVVGAAGGALAIGLIALFIYRRRSRIGVKSASAGSSGLQSDEGRQEGLTQTVE